MNRLALFAFAANKSVRRTVSPCDTLKRSLVCLPRVDHIMNRPSVKTSYDKESLTTRCEVCGKTFQDQPHRAIVEGAKLLVCPTCARHASADWEDPKQPKQQIRAQGRIEGHTGRKPVGTRKSLDTTLDEYALVEDYGAIIRRIREKLGWSQEDLGRKINVKSSLIAKIETKKITPDDSIVKKLEDILSINLLSSITPNTQQDKVSKAATDLTLGDIVVMKKRERKLNEPASDLG